MLPDLAASPLPWQAALVRDGLAVGCPGVWLVAADQVHGPEARARALAPLVPARCTVVDLAAVWIHLGGAAPDRIDAAVDPAARLPLHDGCLRVRRTAVPPGQALDLGGVRVCAVGRALADLAGRMRPERALEILLAARAQGVDLGPVGACLKAGRGPGARRARHLVDLAASTHGWYPT